MFSPVLRIGSGLRIFGNMSKWIDRLAAYTDFVMKMGFGTASDDRIADQEEMVLPL
jgi:hypothetical protein